MRVDADRPGYWLLAGGFAPETITCVGDGAHQGLSAVVQVDRGTAGMPFEGIIFGGEVPPMPNASDFE